MASSESEWEDNEVNNNDDDVSADEDVTRRPPRIKAVPAKLLESAAVNKGAAIESQTSKSFYMSFKYCISNVCELVLL